jgi:hypothetical protein
MIPFERVYIKTAGDRDRDRKNHHLLPLPTPQNEGAIPLPSKFIA